MPPDAAPPPIDPVPGGPLLALDIGNTRLKWALYESAAPDATVLAQGAEFLEQIETLAERAWAGLPRPHRMLGCSVAADAVRHACPRCSVRRRLAEGGTPEGARSVTHLAGACKPMQLPA